MVTTIRPCVTEEEYAAWDRYVFGFPGANYFQTYGWLKSYEPMGFTPHVLVYEVDGTILGGVAFLSAKLPLLPWRIFIIPHGPLPANPEEPGWTPLMQRLEEICEEKRAIYAQLYPHELEDTSILLRRLEEFGFTAPAMFTSHRFSSTPVTLELRDKTEEELLKSFRRNTRYYIKRALNGKLVVRTDVDAKVFDTIYALFLEHGKARGYSPRPYRSLKAVWEWFGPKGEATFIQAWCEEMLVGAILVLFTGQTAYYLAGATKREFSKEYPAELMHWYAIREAIKRHMSFYDLNGGTGSVAQFKAGFRPVYQSWQHPRTKLYRPVLGYLISLGEHSLRPLVRQLGRYRANSLRHPPWRSTGGLTADTRIV